ncbi:hypothetical protein TKK_0003001 [Trichogramma kaykai]
MEVRNGQQMCKTSSDGWKNCFTLARDVDKKKLEYLKEGYESMLKEKINKCIDSGSSSHFDHDHNKILSDLASKEENECVGKKLDNEVISALEESNDDVKILNDEVSITEQEDQNDKWKSKPFVWSNNKIMKPSSSGFCCFCLNAYRKFIRHLLNNHSNEPVIRTIAGLPVQSLERLEALNEIRWIGRQRYNQIYKQF